MQAGDKAWFGQVKRGTYTCEEKVIKDVTGNGARMVGEPPNRSFYVPHLHVSKLEALGVLNQRYGRTDRLTPEAKVRLESEISELEKSRTSDGVHVEDFGALYPLATK